MSKTVWETLSNGTRAKLSRNGVTQLTDLLNLTRDELIRLPGCGASTRGEVEKLLKNNKLVLRTGYADQESLTLRKIVELGEADGDFVKVMTNAGLSHSTCGSLQYILARARRELQEQGAKHQHWKTQMIELGLRALSEPEVK